MSQAEQTLFNKRIKLEAGSKADYLAAQEAYEKSLKKALPVREKARQKRDEALSYWRRRRALTDRSKRALRTPDVPALKPERTRISVNKSSRGGQKPRLIVLHITVSHNRPGMADIDGILEFFDRPATQASSHIINDREGHDARCVEDRDKAWTQGAYNPVSLSIEQIEFKVKSRQEWLDESSKQLDNTALWIAYWSHKHGIPIKMSTTNGVCQHRDLGSAGGGHSDCSPYYPLDAVLARALSFRKSKYGR